MIIFAILAIIFYLMSLGFILPNLLKKNRYNQRMIVMIAITALICHAISVYLNIFSVAVGQDLNLLNIATIISLIIGLVMTAVAILSQAWLLLPVVYSFAVITLLLSTFMPIEIIHHFELRPGMLIHIGLSLFAYATLTIALLYAIQLSWMDFNLKHKRLNRVPEMPPLMVIERKLFHITQVGFILLTFSLLSGAFFIDAMFTDENLHKAILSTFAWFIYALLLWGHTYKGWRGNRVLGYSIVGFILLTFGYFGSRIMQLIM